MTTRKPLVLRNQMVLYPKAMGAIKCYGIINKDKTFVLEYFMKSCANCHEEAGSVNGRKGGSTINGL